MSTLSRKARRGALEPAKVGSASAGFSRCERVFDSRSGIYKRVGNAGACAEKYVRPPSLQARRIPFDVELAELCKV